ncbi:MAG TPA: LPS export ABC transporter periplasmic protein LptC [Melioribacteraceae bacterium]|nr:LPS export ABC transporter periplasmic protein LptC [Melioribacteraceae bacterium]
MRLFISALIIILLVYCSDEKIKPIIENNKSATEIPSHESWNSKITFTNEGKTRAVLFSDHLKKYDLQKITLLEGVKINFYNPEQSVTTVLTSKRGKVDDLTMDMYAIDSVVAVNDSGTVLRTTELKWRNNDEKIMTDKFVSIRSSKEIIEGYGMESDQHLHNYVIFKVTYSASVNNKKQ